MTRQYLLKEVISKEQTSVFIKSTTSTFKIIDLKNITNMRKELMSVKDCMTTYSTERIWNYTIFLTLARASYRSNV